VYVASDSPTVVDTCAFHRPTRFDWAGDGDGAPKAGSGVGAIRLLQERRGGGVGILAACGAILWSPWPSILTAVAWGISGFGIGVAYPASTVLSLNAVDAQHSGDAAASLQIAEMLVAAIGTGITTMLVASWDRERPSSFGPTTRPPGRRPDRSPL